MINLEKTLVSTQLDSRGNSAEELIATTSIVHRLPLLTCVKSIRQSKLVFFARRIVSLLTAD